MQMMTFSGICVEFVWKCWHYDLTYLKTLVDFVEIVSFQVQFSENMLLMTHDHPSDQT